MSDPPCIMCRTLQGPHQAVRQKCMYCDHIIVVCLRCDEDPYTLAFEHLSDHVDEKHPIGRKHLRLV